MQFLQGMSAMATKPPFRGKFDDPRPNQLSSVLLNILVTAREEKMILDNLTPVERQAVKELMWRSKLHGSVHDADGVETGVCERLAAELVF